MNPKELEQLCTESRKIVVRTGQFLMQQKGKVAAAQIEEKSLNSLVSYVDKSAEQQLVIALKKLLPGSVFLTEEETVVQDSGE